jgi:hypothetical protein
MAAMKTHCLGSPGTMRRPDQLDRQVGDLTVVAGRPARDLQRLGRRQLAGSDEL